MGLFLASRWSRWQRWPRFFLAGGGGWDDAARLLYLDGGSQMTSEPASSAPSAVAPQPAGSQCLLRNPLDSLLLHAAKNAVTGSALFTCFVFVLYPTRFCPFSNIHRWVVATIFSAIDSSLKSTLSRVLVAYVFLQHLFFSPPLCRTYQQQEPFVFTGPCYLLLTHALCHVHGLRIFRKLLLIMSLSQSIKNILRHGPSIPPARRLPLGPNF
jgi:hypothetical protein